ncbi:MarR family winged helix-turn-helix transcriptional regulator [Nocardioides hankookensis]|uniref:MarR family winged helix-turn-helix transcriptional regulator n=1 Tax=Nocardioides hankookensis TaxID=443157 RepID=A0ABW1LE89_9ACTN
MDHMGMPDASGSRELLPALAEHPGHLFWRAAARVNVALSEALPPTVDVHAYAALLALAGGAERSQQAIAESISISRTTMVKVAASLSDQGLVTRVRNPNDRRSYALARTPEGAAAARRWRRHIEDLEDAITAGFTLEEREDLSRMLVRVAGPELAPDTPAPLLDSLGFLITRVHFRLHREFAEILEPIGIEPRHVGCLTALDASGPIPQAQLARILGVSGASVVQMVDDLERRGLVERRRLATDRRTQVLHLLPAATDVAGEARRLSGTVLDDRLGPLSAAERKRLTGYLVRFVTAP